jgi:alpha-ketoglutarate-dependent taurine dioxygenase
MKPVLQPENIYAHPHAEQDVILWYNRALWHSIVSLFTLHLSRTLLIRSVQTEFPKSYGPRVMHQCNIAASDHPIA